MMLAQAEAIEPNALAAALDTPVGFWLGLLIAAGAILATIVALLLISALLQPIGGGPRFVAATLRFIRAHLVAMLLATLTVWFVWTAYLGVFSGPQGTWHTGSLSGVIAQILHFVGCAFWLASAVLLGQFAGQTLLSAYRADPAR